MNNKVSYGTVIKRLTENSIAFHVKNMNGFLLIVSEYGGRVFGPFEDQNSESLGWLHSSFNNADDFKELVARRDWNIGGERFWLAPEFAFFVKERKRFDDTYIIQDAMGAGEYTLEEQNNISVLKQLPELDVYEMPFSRKSVYMEREIEEAQNPLKWIGNQNLASRVLCCGYKQTFTIKDQTPENNMYLEAWVLNQINPGGRLIVPFLGHPDFLDYYDPVKEKQKTHSNYFELEITGDVKYKVAYKALNTSGRSAYINSLGDGRYYALIRNYYNDPSNPYCCEPPYEPGKNGCSLYIYNDFGGNGGFAEYENSGITIGGDTSRNESNSEVMSWWFVGKKEDIEAVVFQLIGIEFTIEI